MFPYQIENFLNQLEKIQNRFENFPNQIENLSNHIENYWTILGILDFFGVILGLKILNLEYSQIGLEIFQF